MHERNRLGFGSSATDSNGNRLCRAERCEPRDLLSGLSPWQQPGAVVATEFLPDATVQVGEEFPADKVAAAQTSYYSLGWGRSRLKEVSYEIEGDPANIESVTLMADMHSPGRGGWGKPDGKFETHLATDYFVADGSADFQLGWWGQSIGRRGLRTQVQVQFGIAEDAVGGDIQLGQPDVEITQGWWRWQRSVKPIYVGCENPTITVEQQTTLDVTAEQLVTTDVAVSNQKDIVLTRLEALAEGEDVLFTEAVFWNSGNTSPGQLGENFALWVDTDSNGVVDTILEDGVRHFSNGVIFSDLAGGGYVIPEGESAIFEVHCDVVSNLPANPAATMQLVVHSIEAEVLDDGSSLGSKQIKLHQTGRESTIWSFVDNGTLSATESNTPIRSRQVLLGELSEPLLILNLHSELEATDVTYIGIDVEGESRSIDRFEFYTMGETTPFAYATVGGAEVGDDFGGHMQNMQLVIPEGADEEVFVRARMKPDTSGGQSGKEFTVAVNNVLARGMVSNNDIDVAFPNGPVIGEPNVSVGAKVSSITNANPDGNYRAIPYGKYFTGQHKVSAGSNVNYNLGQNEMVPDGLIYTVDAINVLLATDGFAFGNKADTSTLVLPSGLYRTDGTPIVGDTVTGTVLVQFDDLADSLVQTSIGSGAAQTFVFQTDVIDRTINAIRPSTLQVSLKQFTHDAAFGPLGSHVSWFDRDAGTNRSFGWLDLPYDTVHSTKYGDGYVLPLRQQPVVLESLLSHKEQEERAIDQLMLTI